MCQAVLCILFFWIPDFWSFFSFFKFYCWQDYRCSPVFPSFAFLLLVHAPPQAFTTLLSVSIGYAYMRMSSSASFKCSAWPTALQASVSLLALPRVSTEEGVLFWPLCPWGLSRGGHPIDICWMNTSFLLLFYSLSISI